MSGCLASGWFASGMVVIVCIEISGTSAGGGRLSCSAGSRACIQGDDTASSDATLGVNGLRTLDP